MSEVTITICANPLCGKEFSVPTRYVKRGRGKYCSTSCRSSCRIVSEDTKERMSRSQRGILNHNFGKVTSIEVKEKIRMQLSGNKHYRKFSPMTDATKAKMSLIRKGRTYEEIFGKDKAETLRQQRSQEGMSRIHSVLTKQKMRQRTIERLIANGGILPNIGIHEIQLLDKQEQIDGVRILRQYRIAQLGYIVDGYCPSTNTVYEVYERKHLQPKVSSRDAIRQQEIQSLLDCDFIIIWDR